MPINKRKKNRINNPVTSINNNRELETQTKNLWEIEEYHGNDGWQDKETYAITKTTRTLKI